MLDLGGPLDGLAERNAMREAGVARDALGQEHGVVHGQVLEAFFDALCT